MSIPLTATVLLFVFLNSVNVLCAQTVQGTLRDHVSRRVLDDLVLVLANTVTNKKVEARSDTLGRFAFHSVKPGSFVLSIQRGGRTYHYDLDLVVGEQLQLEIAVPGDTSALEVNAISSRVRKLEIAGFYERHRKGRGQFITREEIDKRSARSLVDLLASMRGVRIERGARGGDAILRAGGGVGALSGGGICRPGIFVDGVLVRQGGNQEPSLVLEQVESPDQVEAIEIYSGASQLPSAYAGTDGACGVILIWTR